MTRSSSTLAGPRENLLRWLGSLGLAATITSSFGFSAGVIASGRDQHSRQCEFAGRLIGDDRLNDALAPQDRGQLVALAAVRVERCLRESL